jgi:thioredoxin 1
MIEVSDENGLTESLNDKQKTVALFYSSWCPFCRSFLSIYNKQAQQPNSCSFIKVRIDEDENPLWEKFGFEAVPSLILFEGKDVASRLDCRLGVGLNEIKFLSWLSKNKIENK